MVAAVVRGAAVYDAESADEFQLERLGEQNMGSPPCPESRFIHLMFHGIHPIEDSKADKLLRSSIYKRSIVTSEVGRIPIMDRAFRIVKNIASPRTLGRVRGVSLNGIARVCQKKSDARRRLR